MEGNDVPPARCNVREATRSDVDAVAALHVAEIHEGFLATLGRGSSGISMPASSSHPTASSSSPRRSRPSNTPPV